MLEISIHKDNQLIYDYKQLNKKSNVKLYNVAVVSLAMFNLDNLAKGKAVLELNGWRFFGINPILIFLPIALMVVGTLIKGIISQGEITLENVLKEVFWLLLALFPAALAIVLWGSNFKIYM